MAWLNELNTGHFLLFTLVLARISGLVATAPIFGAGEVPMQIRALLALALALMVVPTQWEVPLAAAPTLVDYVVVVAAELVVGVVLGVGVQLPFAGVQLGGQLISQASGLSLASVLNPQFDEDVPLFSHLLSMFALAIFVTIGGHRLVLGSLLGTFAAIPPGQAAIAPSIPQALVTLGSESFSLGMRVAAPTITALLLATLVLGLVGRTLPQLNILAFGFGINSLVTFGTLAVAFAAISWAFQDELEPVLETLLDALREAPKLSLSD